MVRNRENAFTGERLCPCSRDDPRRKKRFLQIILRGYRNASGIIPLWGRWGSRHWAGSMESYKINTSIEGREVRKGAALDSEQQDTRGRRFGPILRHKSTRKSASTIASKARGYRGGNVKSDASKSLTEKTQLKSERGIRSALTSNRLKNKTAAPRQQTKVIGRLNKNTEEDI